MRVSDLTRQKPVVAVVELGDGDTVEVSFDRNRVTPAWVAQAEQRDAINDTLSLPKALADVILGWDVTNDDDTAFPPTIENLAVLSFPVQSELLRRILEAAVPSRAEGNASPATSNTASSNSTAPPASPPNGLPTSPSPAPSASPSPT